MGAEKVLQLRGEMEGEGGNVSSWGAKLLNSIDVMEWFDIDNQKAAWNSYVGA